MSERQPSPYDSVARKWHALAERRRLHLIELRESGRWRHYYTAEGLFEALHDAVTMRDAWARIAGLDQVQHNETAVSNDGRNASSAAEPFQEVGIDHEVAQISAHSRQVEDLEADALPTADWSPALVATSG